MSATDLAFYAAIALYLIGAAIVCSAGGELRARARMRRALRHAPGHPALGDLNGRHQVRDGRFTYTCQCGAPVTATPMDFAEFPAECGACGTVTWFRRDGRTVTA